MTEKQARVDAIVHKKDDIPVEKFGEGIDHRYISMNTIAQTWVEMKKGSSSPLHRHEDEQTIVLISGKLRARSGPNGEEIYTDMEPADIMTIPSNVIHQVEALVDSVFCEAFGFWSDFIVGDGHCIGARYDPHQVGGANRWRTLVRGWQH